MNENDNLHNTPHTNSTYGSSSPQTPLPAAHSSNEPQPELQPHSQADKPAGSLPSTDEVPVTQPEQPTQPDFSATQASPTTQAWNTTEFERVHNPYQNNSGSHWQEPSRTQPVPPTPTPTTQAQAGYSPRTFASQQEPASAHNQAPSFNPPQPQAEEQPRKRSIGLVPAMALMLVAAIGSGTVTGLVVNQHSTDTASKSSVLDHLNAPVNQGTAPQAVAGGVQEVAARVLPAVVSIKVISLDGVSEGSGSIISSDGYVLTNNHVVEMASGIDSAITVSLNDGRRYTADFIAGDPNTDVAVVKMRDAVDLPVMNFGDSSQLAVGQEVVAIGSPLGLSATVTSGIVSALNRPVRARGNDVGQSSLIDAIQTDAAINPGNSGGPLVDMNGNQIGVNSMIASLNTVNESAGSIGLGFAIPANFAKRVAQQLIERGEAKQPMIGIQLASNAKVTGALVADVTPGGPGDDAGLKPGDVIVALGNRLIDSADALIAGVRSSDFGQEITLKVTNQRGENEREVVVTLTNE
ncbi:MAG: trypsin-like peptidase domain-containing protein [Corynebacterium sp.]|uniref:trypsin-like peptidase domain-containing protein n=1 Tax=Corynebacterium sp. TaxID=1720 RepID=UPI0026DB833B|nr:trypsin-like peptidase domain-containing protein [Corynebacterium sp.]MDO4761828.1 trypsin-like peptidase domain-containing protein [Corynebacterium sp.]